MISGVQNLGIKLLWDYVDAWNLVIPCAVANHQTIIVCKIFFIDEEANSLYKGTFNLEKNVILIRYGAIISMLYSVPNYLSF
jgi:hypothetical protein